MRSFYFSRSFPRSNSSFFLSSGYASKSSVIRLREDKFLVDTGLAPKMNFHFTPVRSFSKDAPKGRKAAALRETATNLILCLILLGVLFLVDSAVVYLLPIDQGSRAAGVGGAAGPLFLLVVRQVFYLIHFTFGHDTSLPLGGAGETAEGVKPSEEADDISISIPLPMQTPEGDGELFGGLEPLPEAAYLEERAPAGPPSDPEARAEPASDAPRSSLQGEGEKGGESPPLWGGRRDPSPTTGPMWVGEAPTLVEVASSPEETLLVEQSADSEEGGTPPTPEGVSQGQGGILENPSIQSDREKRPSSSLDPTSREGGDRGPKRRAAPLEDDPDIHLRKTQMDEADAAHAARQEVHAALLEKQGRAPALEELLKNTSPEEVRARLVESIKKNWRFADLLLRIPQPQNPLLAEPGPRTALERTLRGILSAQGRSFDSLEDLHNLQCDLVYSEKTRRAALSPFLESYGIRLGGEPEP